MLISDFFPLSGTATVYGMMRRKNFNYLLIKGREMLLAGGRSNRCQSLWPSPDNAKM
jgi:hypothetical protein